MEKLFFLAGLPRTGSTLLTALLSQNKDILSEGTSGLLELMWQTDQLFVYDKDLIKCLESTNKTNINLKIMSSLPALYYDSDIKYVIDKNRNWANKFNIEMIKKYIIANPKIIVMLRPIDEIFESFYYIYKKNKKLDILHRNLFEVPNPFIFPFNNLLETVQNNKEHLLLLTYKELVEKTEETIDRIYEFLGIPKFNHDFTNIKNKYPEDDYGFDGLHKVRSKIKYRHKNVTLPKELKDKALEMQQQLEKALEEAGEYDIFKK